MYFDGQMRDTDFESILKIFNSKLHQYEVKYSALTSLGDLPKCVAVKC